MPILLHKFEHQLILSLITIFFCLVTFNANAQIGIGVNPPDSSAMLHIQDTARGLLIPRMTAAQKNAIQHPADGLMIYQTNEAKGFWYYDGNLWSSVSGNKGGIYSIVLMGNITDDEARAKIAADGGPNTRVIQIINCPNLTTIDLSIFTELSDVVLLSNPILQNVDLRNLESISGYGGVYGGLYISDDTSLTTLNLSSLKNATSYLSYGITILNTKIINLNFPALKKVKDCYIQNNPLITSLSMPLLDTAHTLEITKNAALLNLELPVLTKASAVHIRNNAALVNLAFPSFTSVYELAISSDSSLVSVSLPVLTDFYPYPNNSYYGFLGIGLNPNLSVIDIATFTRASCLTYSFIGNKLNSSAVNNILNKFVAMGPIINGKTISLSGQNPAAPPTGQGLIDKATLISHSNTVSTD